MAILIKGKPVYSDIPLEELLGHEAGVDKNIREFIEPKPAGIEQPAPEIIKEKDYLVLRNISCVDAGGNVFEHYPELWIAKDIVRNENGVQVNFTPYNAAIHFEQQKSGLFLPSMALSCNIVAALFKAGVRKDSDGSYQTLDEEIEKVLQQYKDHGAGFGWQGQNSIADFGEEQVIHYPSAADFGQTSAVNSGRSRTLLSFDKSILQYENLESALRVLSKMRYARQLSGLKDPSILVEVGEYFGKPAKLWFPWSGRNGASYSEKRAAWLGCFYLDAYYGLCIDGAARGVRFALQARA